MGKREIRFFPNISKTVRNFEILSSRFTGIAGLYGMAEKNSGISLKLFRQRAPNDFIGVFLKVH